MIATMATHICLNTELPIGTLDDRFAQYPLFIGQAPCACGHHDPMPISDDFGYEVDEHGNRRLTVFHEMWARVNCIPDTGEGGSWHLASERAWEIEDDYRRACEQDATMLDEWEETHQDFTTIRMACLNDAAKVAL